MDQKKVLQIFKDTGALLEGHFLLSSGLHSRQYLQCAKVLENPRLAQRLCRNLAGNFQKDEVSTCIAPAVGGILVAYELARALGARAIFAERQQARLALRRGFSLSAEDKVLVAEDVITTGGSVKEVIELVKSCGAEIIAVCALADRSQEKVEFGVPLVSLIKLEIENFSAQDCPLCKQKIQLTKPGSRPL